MDKRIATLAALAAAFTMAFAGTASAQLLEAGAGPLGYNSEGTYEGIMDTVDQACAEIGQQDAPENPAVRGSLCVPRPVDEEAGEQPGDNGYELAQERQHIGWASDGFFRDAMNPCFLAGILGLPVQSGRVDPADGVFVAVCD